MGLKEEYRNKFEAQLREWKARIDLLEAKADKVKAELKIDYQQEMETLRRKKEALQARLKDLQEAGEGTWESMKGGVEKAASELKSAVERVISKFKE